MTDTPTDASWPDVSPEDDEFIRGLLASLPDDDPPMPDDVIRRIDAALAAEGQAVGRSTTASSADSDGNVIDLGERRRRSTSTTAFRWIGGVAAAGAAVVGLSVLSGGLSDGGSPVAGGTELAIQATNNAYTTQTFPDTAVALAEAAAGSAPAPELTPDQGLAPTPPGPSTSPALTANDLAGCVQQLAGDQPRKAVLVDLGSYDGKPAAVLVLADTSAAGAYDVWVVGPGCNASGAEVKTFRRVQLPAAG